MTINRDEHFENGKEDESTEEKGQLEIIPEISEQKIEKVRREIERLGKENKINEDVLEIFKNEIEEIKREFSEEEGEMLEKNQKLKRELGQLEQKINELNKKNKENQKGEDVKPEDVKPEDVKPEDVKPEGDNKDHKKNTVEMEKNTLLVIENGEEEDKEFEDARQQLLENKEFKERLYRFHEEIKKKIKEIGASQQTNDKKLEELKSELENNFRILLNRYLKPEHVEIFLNNINCEEIAKAMWGDYTTNEKQKKLDVKEGDNFKKTVELIGYDSKSYEGKGIIALLEGIKEGGKEIPRGAEQIIAGDTPEKKNKNHGIMRELAEGFGTGCLLIIILIALGILNTTEKSK